MYKWHRPLCQEEADPTCGGVLQEGYSEDSEDDDNDDDDGDDAASSTSPEAKEIWQVSTQANHLA